MNIDYEKQAQDFLNKTGCTFKAKYLKHAKYFPDDDQKRDIYEITIIRNTRKWIFKFGQSIHNSGIVLYNNKTNTRTFHKGIICPDEYRTRPNKQLKTWYGCTHHDISLFNCKFEKPTPYDVLSCVGVSSSDNFTDFCDEFGYDTDSIKAKKTYEATSKGTINIERIWTDSEIEELSEIR